MATTIAEKLATQLLCKLDLTQSDFVRGFLMKCASAEYDAGDTVRAINDAVCVSPHVSREFARCGFEKTSGLLFGSAPKAPGAPAAAPIKAPAAPAAPFKPVGSLFGTGPRPAPAAATIKAPATGPQKLPATFNPGGDSPDLSMTDEAFKGLGTGFRNLGRGIWGEARNAVFKPAKLVGDIGEHVVGPVADWTGVTQNLTPAMAEFSQQARDNITANNQDSARVYDPDAWRTSPVRSAVTAKVRNDQNIQRQLGHEFSAGVTGAVNAAGEVISTFAPTLLVGGAAGMLPKVVARGAPALGRYAYRSELAQPFINAIAGANPDGTSVLPVAPSAAVNWVATKLQNGQDTHPEIGTNQQQPVATQENPIVTDQQPPEIQPTVSAAPGVSQQPASTTPPPPEAQPIAAGQQPESVLTQTPEYKEVSTLVQNDPQTATQLGQQAVGQVKQSLDTPEGAAELDALKTTGKLSPEGQQKAMTALTKNKYNWNHAQNTIMNMDGWEQLGLWGGLSLTALGLLHALSGDGGVGSLLIGMLGLGAAGFTAAKTGLLDQGSQDMANSMQNAVMGEPTPAAPPAAPAAPPAAASAGAPGIIDQLKTKAVDTWNDVKPKLQAGAFEAIKPQIPAMIDKMPDQPDPTTAKMLLSLVPPDAAAELDMAIGHGGAGNAIASFLGDFSNTTQRRMTERLGTTPEQNDKLLRQWAYARKTGQ